MNKKNFNPFILGLMFSIISGLCTFTFIVPLITIMPATLMLEGLYGKLYSNPIYENVAFSSMITLLIISILYIIFYFLSYSEKRKNNKSIKNGFALFLIINSFTIHPLGLYLYTANNWNMAKDGMYTLSVFVTYPFSSLVFVCLGLIAKLIDSKYLSHITQ